MKSRWIIGRSEYLDLAFHAWKQARQDRRSSGSRCHKTPNMNSILACWMD